MRRAAVLALLALAACSDVKAPERGNATAGPSGDLESAAIARGLVRDAADKDIAGLYARDTDRLCIVPAGFGYRIGAFVDYGEGITCSGSGRVSRAGSVLHVEFGDGGCSFDARFDGDRVIFPAGVPAACRKLCRGRAGFGALEASRLSDSAAEATALRDARGRRLCAPPGAGRES